MTRYCVTRKLKKNASSPAASGVTEVPLELDRGARGRIPRETPKINQRKETKKKSGLSPLDQKVYHYILPILLGGLVNNTHWVRRKELGKSDGQSPSRSRTIRPLNCKKFRSRIVRRNQASHKNSMFKRNITKVFHNASNQRRSHVRKFSCSCF